MIPDTDEQLLIEAEKYGLLPMEPTRIVFRIHQLRAMLNHYIAKYHAQGQEPVATLVKNYHGVSIKDLRWFDKLDFPDGNYPLYTHAQPVAEIQAEALAFIVQSDDGTPALKFNELNRVSYAAISTKWPDIPLYAAKLRRGESGQ